MKFSTLTALALSLSLPVLAQADWAQIQAEAGGQAVYFNAWGGSEAGNAYINWAAKEVKRDTGLNVGFTAMLQHCLSHLAVPLLLWI